MAENIVAEKRCARCEATKPLSAFHRRLGGYHSRCKKCVSDSYRLSHPPAPVENEPGEEWRPVPEWESFYEASNQGRIRTIGGRWGTTAGYRILRPYKNQCGYLTVVLSAQPRKKKVYFLHRLVAAAFIGERPEGQFVNHLDGDKLNNRPENLEYVTPKGNKRHASQMGLIMRGAEHCHTKLSDDDVRNIRALHEQGWQQKAIAAKYGLHSSTVMRIIFRRTWMHLP